MTPRIVLVRHGPSAHVHDGGAIDRAGFGRWLDAYDAAGIRAAAQPPVSLARIARSATHVIASDLRRAIESAERLAPERRVLVSDLLREAPVVLPAWPTRLPLAAWEMLAHLDWFHRIVRGTDATEADRARAGTAAEWLARIVADGSTAVVVTHGIFRRLVAKELLADGWADAGRHGAYRHWSAWHFSGPAVPATVGRDDRRAG